MESTESTEPMSECTVNQQASGNDVDVIDDEFIPDDPNPHPWIGQECSNNASSLEMHENIVGDVKPKLSSKTGASDLQPETGQVTQNEIPVRNYWLYLILFQFKVFQFGLFWDRTEVEK